MAVECQRCGRCCECLSLIDREKEIFEIGRCSHLEYNDGIASCKIHNDKPVKCRDYPVREKGETCLREKENDNENPKTN